MVAGYGEQNINKKNWYATAFLTYKGGAMRMAFSRKEQQIQEGLQDPIIRRDLTTLGFLWEIYCEHHHDKDERTPHTSVSVDAGVYDKKHHIPQLCPTCSEHLAYGEEKRILCPLTPKPSCRLCEVHCYKPEEAEQERVVMKFAGPRSVKKLYLIKDALRHLRVERGVGSGKK